MNRLRERYQTEVLPKLQQELGLSNLLAAPRLKKVVISTSFLEPERQNEAIKAAAAWIAAIAGQKAAVTRAKKSIAAFNIRTGDQLGLKVTLRENRMWAFIDKLISIALPRVRDFQGISAKGFDGQGNYTLGLTEQIIFPEVEYDTVGKVRGLQITFTTSTSNDKIARKLLEYLGLPFEKEKHGQKKQNS